MAKKGHQSAGSKALNGYSFLEYPLSSADKERFQTLDYEAEFPLAGIGELVSQGYKVSFSEDGRNQTVLCAFTDNRTDSPFHKNILTGRGTSVVHAWAIVCYKHFYIAKEDWVNIAKVDLDGGWG